MNYEEKWQAEREGVEARAAFGDEAAGGLFRRGGVSWGHGTGGAARPSFYPNTGTGKRVWKRRAMRLAAWHSTTAAGDKL